MVSVTRIIFLFLLFFLFIIIRIELPASVLITTIDILSRDDEMLSPFCGDMRGKQLHPFFQEVNEERGKRLVLVKYVGDKFHVYSRPATISDLYVPLLPPSALPIRN